MDASPTPARTNRRPRLLAAAVALSLLLGAGGGALTGFIAGRASSGAPVPALAPTPAPIAAVAAAAGAPPSYADLVERLLPAVVTIESRAAPFAEGRSGAGTGFFYNADGRILTSAHIVPESADPQVRVELLDGRRLDATVVGRDVWGDVAVLEVDGGPFPFLELGRSDEVRVGEPVFAIGSPSNFRHSVSFGVVSGMDRSVPRPMRTNIGQLNIPFRGVIQTDAAINPGNSGGPLVTTDGRVVGISMAVDSSANSIGFAVAITPVAQRLAELESTGAVARGFLGIRYTVIDPNREMFADSPFPFAAAVGQVVADSTARAAGLRGGDVILAVNGQTLTRGFTLSEAVDALRVGDPITFRVSRANETLDLTSTLQARPEPANPG